MHRLAVPGAGVGRDWHPVQEAANELAMLCGCQGHGVSLLLERHLCVLAPFQGQASETAGRGSLICSKL